MYRSSTVIRMSILLPTDARLGGGGGTLGGKLRFLVVRYALDASASLGSLL